MLYRQIAAIVLFPELPDELRDRNISASRRDRFQTVSPAAPVLAVYMYDIPLQKLIRLHHILIAKRKISHIKCTFQTWHISQEPEQFIHPRAR